MKTQKLIFIFFLSFLTFQGMAQANGNLTKKEYQLSGFRGIEAGGAIRISFTQAEQYAVFFETDENILNQIGKKKPYGIILNVWIRPRC